MTTRRLTPIDAQTFWLAGKIPNDTFLLFGFAGAPSDVAQTLADVEARARGCRDLSLRIDDHGWLAYPSWAHRDVDRSQFVLHDLDERTWGACLAAVCGLIDEQLDAGHTAWRLHVFTDVVGVPAMDGPGTVAVLQISHAMGGGGRTSALAALMFGRAGVELPDTHQPSTGPVALPLAGFRAAKAHRKLLADV